MNEMEISQSTMPPISHEQVSHEPWQSIPDLYPIISRLIPEGSFRYALPGSSVSISPLNIGGMIEGLPDDTDMMRRTVTDRRANMHIEDLSGTVEEEYPGMASEMWRDTGERWRFTPRLVDGTGLGIMNCAALDPDVEAANPGLYRRVLGTATRFTGELAYYHAQGVPGNEPIVMDTQVNELAERTKARWLQTLRSKTFRNGNAMYETDIQAAMAMIAALPTGHSEKYGGKAVLTTPFGLGYATMLDEIARTCQQKGIAENDLTFLLFIDQDPPNPESFRMLLPFGAEIEAVAAYPAPTKTDPDRMLTRIVLSQRMAGIRDFIEYAKPYLR